MPTPRVRRPRPSPAVHKELQPPYAVRLRRRPSAAKAFSRVLMAAFSANRLRVLAVCGCALALAAASIYAGRSMYLERTDRTLSVCLLTDARFRLERPAWKHQVALWFHESNRVFAPSRVRWEAVPGGDAYPEGTQGDLDERRERIEREHNCRADVLLALTGGGDAATNVAVAPFGRTVLLAVTHGESDAMAVTAIVRALANLFGVEDVPRAVVTTDWPDDAVLDASTLQLITDLRGYEFARGISALPGRWERRAAAALERWFSPRSETPAAEAHRTLARAYAASARHFDAVAHLREAVRSAPRDVLLRLNLALELQADAQLDEAFNEISEALRIAPEDARPHAVLGGFLFNRGRMEAAVDELRTAVRLDPDHAPYRTLLGRALSTQLGAQSDAAETFRAALRLNPRNGVVTQRLALVENALAAMDPIVAELRNEIAARPGNSDAHLRLGVALAQAGRNTEAETHLRKSIELDRENGMARLALARLKYAAGDYETARLELETAKAAGRPPFAAFAEAVASKTRR